MSCGGWRRRYWSTGSQRVGDAEVEIRGGIGVVGTFLQFSARKRQLPKEARCAIRLTLFNL